MSNLVPIVVTIHHHFTVLQTLAVGGFQKAVDAGEPDLVLGINGSIANLVTVFPFDGHGLGFSFCQAATPKCGSINIHDFSYWQCHNGHPVS